MRSLHLLALAALPFTLVAAIAGCTTVAPSGGGGGGLAPGLIASMDQPGASLDRAQALGLLNAYRSSVGAPALVADPALDATAQALATQYANSNNRPVQPPGVVAMPLSAGYGTFAETFSGWRNSPSDARVLAQPTARRAGLGVAYNANSGYGVHWVLLLDD
jgi:uncharacterized protein YkwD